MTTSRTRFDPEAGTAPVALNYADGIVARSTAQLVIQISGFEPGDTLQQVTFTAKVNVADADDAATTIQKTLELGDDAEGTLDPVPLNARAYLAVFQLTADDTDRLLAATRTYDVKAWVLHDGITVERVLQSGTISASQNITGAITLETSTGAGFLVTPGPEAVARAAQTFLARGLASGKVVALGAGKQLQKILAAAAALYDVANGRGDNGIFVNYHAGDPTAMLGATVTRSGSAWQRDATGVWKIAGTNVWRDNHYPLTSGYAGRQFIGEPGATNLCPRTCLYGTNGIAGWSKSGDAAAILSAADDTAELTSAGLYDPSAGASGGLAGDTFCLKLDNSAGVADAFAVSPSLGTLAATAYSFYAFVRGGSGAIFVACSGNKGVVNFGAQAHYTKTPSRNVTMAAAAGLLQIKASAGQIVYFVLAQVENTPAETSPIPNSTSGVVSRATDKFIFPYTHKPQSLSLYGRFTWLSPYNTGQFVTIGQGGASSGQILQTVTGLGTRYSAFLRNAASTTNSALGALPNIGDDAMVAARFSAAGVPQVELSLNGGASTLDTAGAPLAYDPSFAVPIVTLGNAGSGPVATPFVGSHIVIARGTSLTLAQLEAL